MHNLNILNPLKKYSVLLIILLLSQISKAQINVNSTSGVTVPTTYTTLKSAFDAINTGTHSGVISITIVGNTTETNSCVLNASGNGLCNYNRINISPSGGFTRIISGSIVSGSPLIDLNGADSVTIDGIAGTGGDSLILSNTTASSIAGTSTIRLIAGATRNIITNCAVLGSTTSSTSGVITVSTDESINGTGNDYNVISNNSIANATSTFPRYGIYSLGTITKENNNLNISFNNIYNYFTNSGCAGVYLTSNTLNASIIGNHLFQTSSRNLTGTYFGIYVANSSSSFTINENYIGGSEKFCSGLPTTLTGAVSLQAIYINSSASLKSNIQGNKIANFSISTTSTSASQSILFISAGKVFIGDIIGNVFGDNLIDTSINYSATASNANFSVIAYGLGTMDTILIKNNQFAGITIAGTGGMSLRGVDIIGSSAKTIIDNNIFGSLITTNSLTQLTNSSLFCIINKGSTATFINQIINNKFVNLYTLKSALRAISIGSSSSWNISNNEIYNLRTSYQSPSSNTSAALVGIISTSIGSLNQTIQNNKIYNLFADATAASSVIGIICSNTSNGINKVDRNIVHSLNSNSAQNGYLIGIEAGSGNYTYSNNFVRLGINENGTSNTNSNIVLGIVEFAGDNNFYHNSVYIGGNGVLSSLFDTYGFLSISSTGNRTIYNNIFSNLRTNANGTALNFSIGINNVLGTDIKNNVYWTGTNFIAQNFTTNITSLTNFKSIFTTDTFSLNVDPMFVNATGIASSLDLHIFNSNLPSSLESAGRVINDLITDFDNDVRPGPIGSIHGGGANPDIGADEFDGIPLTTCSLPIAGNTIANDTVSCNGSSIILQMSGNSFNPITNIFQWEKSTNGINYTSILNAIDTIYIASGLNVNTYFRCKITCTAGLNKVTSTAILINAYTIQVNSYVNDTICEIGSAVLSATPSKGIIQWYENLNSSSPIATGNTFITPTLTSTKTYYAEAKYNSCVGSFRYPVTAYITAKPTIVNNSKLIDTVCGEKVVDLYASTSSGVINWYTSSTSTNSVFTGDTLSININSDTTFFAEPSSDKCYGQRIPFQIKYLRIPLIDSIHNNIACGESIVQLEAFSVDGNIYWYDSPNSNIILGQGSTFTTPVLNSTTSYYVQSKNQRCESNRIEVRAIINDIPTVYIYLNKDTLQVNKPYESYEWYKDNLIIPNAIFSYLIPTSNGIYKVKVTDINTCTNLSNEININKTGINLENNKETLITPNPTFQQLNIYNISSKYIEILDLQGRIMLKSNFSTIINVESLNSGVYFIKFIDSNMKVQEVHKFMKIE